MGQKYPPKPMRGWPGTDLHRHLIEDPEWIAEPKKNGERCIVQSGRLRNENGSHTIKILTRRNHIMSGVPQILQDILGEMMNHGIHLDCEFVDKSLIWLFDIPNLPLPLKARRKRLVEFYEYRTSVGDRKLIKLMPWIPKETAYESSVANGDEGTVFKNINSLYVPQLESNNETPCWVKFKKPENW